MIIKKLGEFDMLCFEKNRFCLRKSCFCILLLKSKINDFLQIIKNMIK